MDKPVLRALDGGELEQLLSHVHVEVEFRQSLQDLLRQSPREPSVSRFLSFVLDRSWRGRSFFM